MKVVRVYKAKGHYKLRAFFDIKIENFKLNGFKLLEDKGKFYVETPMRKARSGYWPVINILNNKTKRTIKNCILEAFKDIKKGKLAVEPLKSVTADIKNRSLTTQEKIEISKRYFPPGLS